MTIRTLASKLAKLEGKKSQARIGDIRELLKLLSQLEATSRKEQDVCSGEVFQVLEDQVQKLTK